MVECLNGFHQKRNSLSSTDTGRSNSSLQAFASVNSKMLYNRKYKTSKIKIYRNSWTKCAIILLPEAANG